MSSHPAVIGRSGAAATSHPLATRAALDVLRDGGSAVDAALAANAMLAVVEPTGCGPGGDLFAMVWDPEDGRLVGLNGSGRSAMGVSADRLRERMGGHGTAPAPSGDRVVMPMLGPLTVTVPGAVDAWFMLHGRFGRMPMARLLGPAIEVARRGFDVTPAIARDWAASLARYDAAATEIGYSGDLDRVFRSDGRAPLPGERFANPDLAATLELLCLDGRSAFYRGPVAQSVDALLRRAGGALRSVDFAAHAGTWVEPVLAPFRGYLVAQLPPNGQGLTVLQMLALVERVLPDPANADPGHVVHLQIEAKKLAFADRSRWIADPESVPDAVDRLLDPGRLDALAGRIHPDRAAKVPGATVTGDTVNLATADRNGMMVSLIQSNFSGLGSGLVAPGTGFGLHNRGALFSMQPGHPNTYAPGRRPFHTIIPGFLLRRGAPVMAFGVMGADMQPQGQVQVLGHLVDGGLALQQAGDAPRWRHDGGPTPRGEPGDESGVVVLEPGFESAVRSVLERRGHTVRFAADGDGFGGYQAVWRHPDGTYEAATERRKDGLAQAF